MTRVGLGDAHPFHRLPAALRYAVALGLISAVFLIDRLAGPGFDNASHFLLLSTAVTASAWFAGTGPALAAVIASAIMGAVTTGYGPASHPGASLHLALFVVQGLLLTGLVAELRSARRAAEQMVQVEQAARREGEAASRMKDEFLATVSHELRTPLNAVLGWVHLLRTGKLDQETAVRGLEAVERNIRLQAQLTGDLLDVSKALTGRLEIESRPVALNEAARLATAAAGPAARARGIELVRHIPEEPIPVLGDATRLRQLIWHLLANAIKFSRRDGIVEIAAGTREGEAWLRVTDSGSGIDPEFLPRIFDRFTQADSSATRTAGGLGIGLALVRELVEVHGGDIQARNREDRAGAVFTATFPLQPAESLATAPRRHTLVLPPVAGPPLNGLRVLVMDESEDGRVLVETVLQQHGATVRSVASVGDALESLEHWRPDVLVSDSSPDRDSYALVGKLQSLDADRGGRIPALALTSARRDEPWSRLLDEVQCDLPKPVDPSILASEVARLTGRERRRARR